MNTGRPLVVTMGEPAGIGLDTVIMAWQALRQSPDQAFVLLGDAELLQSRAASLGQVISVKTVNSSAESAAIFGSALPVLHRNLPNPPKAGHIDPRNAPAVVSLIEEAVELALQQQCSGIVTCPIQKETLYGAGFQFEGHTDFLAHLARLAGHQATPVMMLVAGDLRTVPVTIHIPLKDVPGALTTQSIIDQTRIVNRDLRLRFGIAVPRIGMTGLNPHAGEAGTIGTEEMTTISPAIAALKAEGMNVVGPLPGDTAFHAEARAGFDAIVCMYHDQALIPVKTLDFHGGVNVTLGLPFIRASPDHGTALSLAGTGTANPRSLISAMELAHKMAARS